MLKFNEETKVVFASDEAAVEPIREITRDEIPDLIANGATVDASADDLGNAALVAKEPDASATSLDTDVDPNAQKPTELPPKSSTALGAADLPNDSALNGGTDDDFTKNVVSTKAEAPTLEQRVSDLEHALVNLPHSIATVMHRGSMDAEEFAKAVIAHLFGKE